MFFGDVGASHTMQRVVELILAEAGVSEFTAAYIDNIIIFTKDESVEQHAEKVKRVIQALTKVGLKLNPVKCKIGLTAARILGHLMLGDARTADPVKVDTMQSLRRPQKGEQVAVLLGFTNFLREYIPMYAMIVGPLEQLRKHERISDQDWEGKPSQAFEMLKKVLSEAPILELPDWDRPFKVGTDSSQYGVGAVLYQEDKDGRKHYIAFAARALNKHQKNYPAIKRELLAIIFALKKWREVLWGSKFTLETDHKALTYMLGSSNRMILDWLHLLSDFQIEVKQKPEFSNVLPHNLSHMYDMVEKDSEHNKGEETIISELQVDGMEDIRMRDWRKEFVENVLQKELVPEGKRKELVKKMHVKSHVGSDGLYRVLFRSGVYWDEMKSDCNAEAKECEECLKYNVGRVGFHPLRPLTASRPMDHIAIDLIGPFWTTEAGYNFILIIVDVATRFVFLRPLRVKSMEAVAWELMKVFCDFGVPRIMQCDNDTAFVNQVLDALKEYCGFERRAVIEYHPEQNGLVERFVREVKQVLKKRLRGQIRLWEKLVPAI